MNITHIFGGFIMENQMDINKVRRKVQAMEDDMLRCRDRQKQYYLYEELQKTRKILWGIERRLRACI